MAFKFILAINVMLSCMTDKVNRTIILINIQPCIFKHKNKFTDIYLDWIQDVDINIRRLQHPPYPEYGQ